MIFHGELPIASNASSEEAWFCLRAQAKHEHIAAAHLRQHLRLEVFLPRVRFKRLTRQGAAWTTEAMFLGYVFARFNAGAFLRQVQHARGVRGIVHFGSRWPTIPEKVIAELRTAVGKEELRVLTGVLNPGDAVEIAGGTFHGLQAVVSRVMPGKQRVAILLDFLGRQTAVELAESELVPVKEPHFFGSL